MKQLLYITLFLISFANAFGQQNVVVQETNTDEVFTVVDEMPEFPGGQSAMMQFISKEVHYPEEAIKKGLQGKVFVKFVVNADGKISNRSIVKSSGSKLLDDEALRVVSIMPIWKPGRNAGKPVMVYYNLPINFKL